MARENFNAVRLSDTERATLEAAASITHPTLGGVNLARAIREYALDRAGEVLAPRFPCGHSYPLESRRARERWEGAESCPRCWAARPSIRLLVTRRMDAHGVAGLTEERWWPGCRVEVTASEALGESTPQEAVDLARRAAEEVLRLADIEGQPDTSRLDDPRWAEAISRATVALRGLGHLSIGGMYARRVGLLAAHTEAEE